MKTVADFKRAMVVGSKWTSVHAAGKKVTGRTCVKVGATQFALTRMVQGATDGESWCDFPKAKDAEFSPDGKTVTIFFDSTDDMTCSESLRRREPILHYTLEETV